MNPSFNERYLCTLSRSKIQFMYAHSSGEAKYRPTTMGVNKLLCLKILLKDLNIKWKIPL